GPGVFTAAGDSGRALPFGPFAPEADGTLERALRRFVADQTPFELGYVEQLYTFGDQGRNSVRAGGEPHFISVGYLALTRPVSADASGGFSPWYRFFPWEDWREGRPTIIDEVIAPRLKIYAKAGKSEPKQKQRMERARLCFGLDGLTFDDEKVLERYELLYEAGLVAEASRDTHLGDGSDQSDDAHSLTGPAMAIDHRRVLATAISRLRAKIKYRPIIFELMPPTFTLTELQKAVEAIAGAKVHKQNFRRLIDKSGLVEGTGRKVTQTGGRPAEQFRFRPEAVRERLNPGVRLPGRRG
ncbi:MAG: NUDIX hydrolase, partial [Alphaproteobacteria bacterium]